MEVRFEKARDSEFVGDSLMKSFLIRHKATYVGTLRLEANSEEEAIAKVDSGTEDNDFLAVAEKVDYDSKVIKEVK